MADTFLAEQSTWQMARSIRTDDEDSWVMLTRDGKIVPIPNERILYTSRTRVSLELSTPKELRVDEPFGIKSSDGFVYITNERVIYLPATPTETFKSFFTPILNISDTHVYSSWMIGPWIWAGIVRPVPGGGIPMGIPRIELKFIFKEGGHHDFQNKYEWLKERLQNAREMGVNPGHNFEPPPPYDLETAGPSGANVTQQPEVDVGSQHQPPQPAPDEPPPDYLEAQTQAVNIQYEERTRSEAERH